MHWKTHSTFALVLALWGNAAHAKKPEIVIDPGGVTPQSLQVITQAVNVIATQAEDQDGGEADRLRRRARDATQTALTTQGYFASEVTLEPDTDALGETWNISIKAGKRSTIAGVDLTFAGRITGDDYAERIAALRRAWLLPEGRPFINADWNKAKSELLNSVSSKDFLLARMTSSEAAVDPDAGEVRLRVDINSGPAVKMGELETTGLTRVPESLIGRYIRYRPGAAYDQDKLDTWQQDLQGTSFFRGAFVSLQRPGGPDMSPQAGEAPDERGNARDAQQAAAGPAKDGLSVGGQDPTSPRGDARVAGGRDGRAAEAVDPNGEITLPVRVRVVEAPPKRLSASIGVDDSAGVRLETQYRQNVVLGQPVTLETGVGLDRLRQRAYADIGLPPDQKGNKDSVGVLADRSDIEGLKVTRFALGATRLRERAAGDGSRVEYENRWGLLAAHDRIEIDGEKPYNLPTLTATAEWLRRDVNSKYDPREGNLISLGTGVGVTLDNGEPFTRLRARAQKWWPIGERDVLTTRAEVGKVWSAARVSVPDDFGFRTGGARSIRGYRYQSIGTKRGDATVGAPALAVASVEYDHYFDERFGVGVFVDAGDAAESFGDMKMAIGYGVGGRVRTPAGPLFLDVAWGQRERDLRLHFSLGLAF